MAKALLKWIQQSAVVMNVSPYSHPETPKVFCTTKVAPIQLVSVYLVERGLILEPYEVEHKSNEIKVLPELVKQFACQGAVFDAINTQKKLSANC